MSAAVRAALLASASLLLASCAGGPTLTVVVRTDFEPGVEFAHAEVLLDGALQTRAAAASEDWLGGIQAAQYGGVTSATHEVVVTLVDGGGAAITHRRVVLTISASYTLVVELTRTCASRRCPGTGDPPNATECLGSRCVDPHCGGTDTAACPASECTLDSDCPAPAAACASVACDHGLCLYAGHDDLCPPATPVCDLVAGCVPMGFDAGPVDMGGGDAGPGDAGTDLGPPDLGTDFGVDMGCTTQPECIEGNVCTADSCVAGTCVHTPTMEGRACDAGMLYCGGGGGGTGTVCQSGVCAPSFGAVPCPDDGNPCTMERCGTGMCRHSFLIGTSCTVDGGCVGMCDFTGRCAGC